MSVHALNKLFFRLHHVALANSSRGKERFGPMPRCEYAVWRRCRKKLFWVQERSCSELQITDPLPFSGLIHLIILIVITKCRHRLGTGDWPNNDFVCPLNCRTTPLVHRPHLHHGHLYFLLALGHARITILCTLSIIDRMLEAPWDSEHLFDSSWHRLQES